MKDWSFSLRRNRPFVSVEDVRLRAQRRLPRMIFDVIDGGAGNEAALTGNRAALDAIALLPRVMADIRTRSAITNFLGTEYDLPFGIAPMGTCNLAGPWTDLALAQVARERQLPMTVSSASSTSMEEIREAAGQRAWFQLYVGGSVDQAIRLVDRAENAGYDVLVLTVDVPQVGRRYRDMRNGFTIPLRLSPGHLANYTLHPRWTIATALAGAPRPVHYGEHGFDRSASRAAADWAFLQMLRERWRGNLIVKGVMCAEDALRIRNLGADAIWVSNHGGRQLDAAPAAITALGRIRDALGPEYPLCFDSGVRTGSDIARALAIGADFVMLGRPFLFASAAGGYREIRAMVDGLASELDTVMAQIGANTVAGVERHVLACD